MPPSDPQPVPPESSGQELPPGARLEEFVVEKVLGSGGFGITYLARDEKLGRKVVVKENLPVQFAFRDPSTLSVASRRSAEDDGDNYRYSLDSFEREAATLASLDHPGIVRVLRSFEANGTACFVMPFVEGDALDGLIRKRFAEGRPFSEEEIVRLLEKVLEALAYLHSRGLYHRDLKPGNILVTGDGDPVLIDFGAARQSLGERSLTVIESPGYTPFEQLQSHGKIGPWSDLYALGATLRKAITNETPMKAADRVMEDPLLPLARIPELGQRYSAQLLASIDRAMSPRAADRYQDAQQWLQELRGAPSQGAASTEVGTVYGAAERTVAAEGAPSATAMGHPEASPADAFAPGDRGPIAAPKSRGSFRRPARKRLGGGVFAFLFLIALVSVGAWWGYPYLDEAMARGTLSVDGPPGAVVRIEGRTEVLRVPFTIKLAPGSHTLSASLEGWPDETESFEVVRDKTQEIDVEFPPVRLVVETSPEGATVRDERGGRDLGTTPLSLVGDHHLPPGDLQLSISKPGYRKASATVELVAGLASSVSVDLEAVPEEMLPLASRDRPFVNALGLEFIPVPDARGRWMSRTPVRVGDFEAFVEATGHRPEEGALALRVRRGTDGVHGPEWVTDPNLSWRSPGFEQGSDHPVVCVSQNDAEAFCRWLSSEEMGLFYRLPSEEEWRAAAGGGAYPWGMEFPPASPTAGNFLDESGVENWPGSGWAGVLFHRDGVEFTAPVGGYSENRFGFLDLAGNVREWCGGSAAGGGAVGVVRGSSWADGSPQALRSEASWNEPRDTRRTDLGFRLVVSLEPGAP